MPVESTARQFGIHLNVCRPETLCDDPDAFVSTQTEFIGHGSGDELRSTHEPGRHDLSGVVTAGLTGLSGAAIAHAGPPPPCSYTLSPPEVAQIGGVSMVIANVAPSECGFPARPGLAVSCVQPQGADSVVSCSQGSGENPAQVSVPYRPGTTDVSTGRACGAWAGIRELAPDRQLLGPLTATLQFLACTL